LAVARIDGDKVRVTSLLWPEPKVILKDEVLVIRNVDGRLQLARMRKHHDDWNPPFVSYDPYGPGQPVEDVTP
jgi:hypothetical protein